MLEAFRDIGYDVDVIMGEAKERKRKIKLVEQNIRNGVKYEFMYSESSTMPTPLTERHHLPTHLFLDYNFWKLCQSQSIPIGLFYRDVYWRFDEYTDSVGKLKSWYTTFFYNLDITYYKKYIDFVFLPTVRMSKVVPQLQGVNVCDLPPAVNVNGQSTKRNFNKENGDKIHIIYVGGISSFYNLELFCQVVSDLNNHFTLTICCRKEEWLANQIRYEKYLINNNIEILHEKGENLKNLYEKADMGCLYMEPHHYRSFAMPMKLFEYLEFKLPILTVSDTAAGDFVLDNRIGWVIPYDSKSLSDCLHKLIDDKARIMDFEENIEKAIEENTWSSRAAKVAESLTVTG
ncbi:glycosyltransferase [Parapedobacter sp.]